MGSFIYDTPETLRGGGSGLGTWWKKNVWGINPAAASTPAQVQPATPPAPSYNLPTGANPFDASVLRFATTAPPVNNSTSARTSAPSAGGLRELSPRRGASAPTAATAAPAAAKPDPNSVDSVEVWKGGDFGKGNFDPSMTTYLRGVQSLNDANQPVNPQDSTQGLQTRKNLQDVFDHLMLNTGFDSAIQPGRATVGARGLIAQGEESAKGISRNANSMLLAHILGLMNAGVTDRGAFDQQINGQNLISQHGLINSGIQSEANDNQAERWGEQNALSREELYKFKIPNMQAENAYRKGELGLGYARLANEKKALSFEQQLKLEQMKHPGKDYDSELTAKIIAANSGDPQALSTALQSLDHIKRGDVFSPPVKGTGLRGFMGIGSPAQPGTWQSRDSIVKQATADGQTPLSDGTIPRAGQRVGLTADGRTILIQ